MYKRQESSQESMSSIVKRWQAFASTTRYLCCTTSTSSMTGCRRLPSGWGPTLRKVKARTRTRLRDELSSAVSDVAFWMGVMVWEPLSQRGAMQCNGNSSVCLIIDQGMSVCTRRTPLAKVRCWSRNRRKSSRSQCDESARQAHFGGG